MLLVARHARLGVKLPSQHVDQNVPKTTSVLANLIEELDSVYWTIVELLKLVLFDGLKTIRSFNLCFIFLDQNLGEAKILGRSC